MGGGGGGGRSNSGRCRGLHKLTKCSKRPQTKSAPMMRCSGTRFFGPRSLCRERARPLVSLICYTALCGAVHPIAYRRLYDWRTSCLSSEAVRSGIKDIDETDRALQIAPCSLQPRLSQCRSEKSQLRIGRPACRSGLSDLHIESGASLRLLHAPTTPRCNVMGLIRCSMKTFKDTSSVMTTWDRC